MADSSTLSGSGIWSHNLRTLACSSFDSDSSVSDTPPTAGHQHQSSSANAQNSSLTISEDARLIRQMDLSLRHDEAVFKPNPWTIAKVNAAARPPQWQDHAKFDHQPTQTSRSPHGRIVEGLRKQAQITKAKSCGEPTSSKGLSKNSEDICICFVTQTAFEAAHSSGSASLPYAFKSKPCAVGTGARRHRDFEHISQSSSSTIGLLLFALDQGQMHV
jgi:hypothetical protein